MKKLQQLITALSLAMTTFGFAASQQEEQFTVRDISVQYALNRYSFVINYTPAALPNGLDVVVGENPPTTWFHAIMRSFNNPLTIDIESPLHDFIGNKKIGIRFNFSTQDGPQKDPIQLPNPIGTLPIDEASILGSLVVNLALPQARISHQHTQVAGNKLKLTYRLDKDPSCLTVDPYGWFLVAIKGNKVLVIDATIGGSEFGKWKTSNIDLDHCLQSSSFYRHEILESDRTDPSVDHIWWWARRPSEVFNASDLKGAQIRLVPLGTQILATQFARYVE